LGLYRLYQYGVLATSTVARLLLWIIAVMFLAAVFALMWRMFRSDRVARFWMVGMLLSVIPACSIEIPAQRLFLFIGLGGMGLVAQLIGGVMDQSSWLPDGRMRRAFVQALCVGFLCLHLLYPLHLKAKLLHASFSSKSAVVNPSTPPTDFRVNGDQDLIIVNSPKVFALWYLPYRLVRHMKLVPAHIRLLTGGGSPIEVTRTGEAALVIRSIKGCLIPTDFRLNEDLAEAPRVHISTKNRVLDASFRSKDLPMKRGERIDLPGLSIEISELGMSGFPSEAVFRFDRKLEDPSFKWLKWDPETDSYTSFTPPAIGATITISGPLAEIPLP
jgi:hypothetical protein